MRIRAATLNTWGLPAPFSRDLTARMRAIEDRLPELEIDVMAFQEVWTARVRRALVAAGERSGLPYVWHNQAWLGGGGLLILSRFPIVDVRFERFALRGDPVQLRQGEYLSGKGFARVRVSSPAGLLSVVDTHLHARYSSTVSHEYRAHRVAQIVQLAAALAEIREPLLVMGDFNLGEGDPEYAVLTGLTGVRDAAAELGHRLPTVFRANPYRRRRTKPDRRIDLVLLRGGLRHQIRARAAERVFDEPLAVAGQPAAYSNHAGVLVEAELIPEAGPRSFPAPDLRALELAAGLLRKGRFEVERRRSDERTASCLGVAVAGAAALGGRAPRVRRRRFLRFGLRTAALLALTPGVGLSVLSEGVRPWQIDAFQEAAARLAQLERLAASPLPS